MFCIIISCIGKLTGIKSDIFPRLILILLRLILLHLESIMAVICKNEKLCFWKNVSQEKIS